ncbi:DUF2334 domain-containing protein [Solibacillus sp. FSL W7-1324]|uniref:DUF2334 domain-containing protein n=1 Tax=Solibacillus sp. FSL W7-1324 TaxID=2921701 RepID=UPI0030FC2FF6
MKKKLKRNEIWVYIILICFFTILQNPSVLAAKEIEEPKVLVIYTTKDGELNHEQRYLDLLISHFTSDIQFMNSDNVKKSDLTTTTHLVYFGQTAKLLPAELTKMMEEYEGTILAIGYNSEQLGSRFAFVKPLNEVTINQLQKKTTDKTLDIPEINAVEIEVSDGTEVLINGSMRGEERSYPIMVGKRESYYYGFDNIDSSRATLFAESLHDVFNIEHDEIYPGYIRLEDVHPLTDPKPLKEIALMLKEKNIPYMVAVIPIYINPITGKRTTFADSPELLKVLKQIQKDGGSIILHGYTHQYRASETGEGFEFWDVENNSPIYFPEHEKFKLKELEDFSTRDEYIAYINELKVYEREYTETKINKGIDELAKYGLYPLAFEAPHYTMSQYGYEILSGYFSTYVGQVQISDKDWEIMSDAPYITSPSFLHGMNLLPETMGYIDPDDENAIQNLMGKRERIRVARDGILSAFYHPYLGSEKFKELLNELDQLTNVSWIDLKKTNVWVNGKNVSIHTENGEIITDVNRYKIIYSSWDALIYYIGQIVSLVAWILVGIGSIAVCMFIMFTFHFIKKNKQIEG